MEKPLGLDLADKRNIRPFAIVYASLCQIRSVAKGEATTDAYGRVMAHADDAVRNLVAENAGVATSLLRACLEYNNSYTRDLAGRMALIDILGGRHLQARFAEDTAATVLADRACHGLGMHIYYHNAVRDPDLTTLQQLSRFPLAAYDRLEAAYNRAHADDKQCS